MAFEITPAHARIFDHVRRREGNVAVSAIAGSGKTSTILQMFDPDSDHLYLSFARKNAIEVKRKLGLPENDKSVRTLNSLGHGAWFGYRIQNNMKGDFKIDKNKLSRLAMDAIDKEQGKNRREIIKLARLGKMSGIIPSGHGIKLPKGVVTESLLTDELITWKKLIRHHDMPEYGKDTEAVIMQVRKLLASSLADVDTLDFDDQLYMSWCYNARIKARSNVFCDEAQDLSPLQHELVARTVNEHTILTLVGDEFQAIYGFRGADANSMKTMIKRFDCTLMPLHVSYRCPQNVIKEAQEYVKHVTAHPNAPMGTIEHSTGYKGRSYNPGEMVVCRYNAPLIQLCIHLIITQRNLKVKVTGNNIAAQISALISQFKPTSVEDLVEKAEAHFGPRISEAQAKGKDEKVARLTDKKRMLVALAHGFGSIAAIMDFVTRYLDDDDDMENHDPNIVTLSTIHRAKGLEADNVIFLYPEFLPAFFATKKWQIAQERNLAYVAVTRAKKVLHYVHHPKMEKIPFPDLKYEETLSAVVKLDDVAETYIGKAELSSTDLFRDD